MQPAQVLFRFTGKSQFGLLGVVIATPDGLGMRGWQHSCDASKVSGILRGCYLPFVLASYLLGWKVFQHCTQGSGKRQVTLRMQACRAEVELPALLDTQHA